MIVARLPGGSDGEGAEIRRGAVRRRHGEQRWRRRRVRDGQVGRELGLRPVHSPRRRRAAADDLTSVVEPDRIGPGRAVAGRRGRRHQCRNGARPLGGFTPSGGRSGRRPSPWPTRRASSGLPTARIAGPIADSTCWSTRSEGRSEGRCRRPGQGRAGRSPPGPGGPRPSRARSDISGPRAPQGSSRRRARCGSAAVHRASTFLRR